MCEMIGSLDYFSSKQMILTGDMVNRPSSFTEQNLSLSLSLSLSLLNRSHFMAAQRLV